MKKFLAMLLTVTMLGGVLAGCGGGSTATPAPESSAPAESGAPETTPVETVDLTVGFMSNYGSLWSAITAEKKGYFAEEGLNVTLTGFDSGPNIIAAMESGSVNFGYIGDGAHKLCVQGNAAIIGLSHISNGDAVIGGPNVKTLEDLKGKTVAYSSGTSSETILTNALNSVGLTMSDIKAMDMDASAVVTAMLSGGVDACAIWSPQSLTIMDEMADATKLAENVDYSDISISLASWIAKPDYLEANRDVAVRFMRAIFKAMDYAAQEEHYEEVSQWVADYLALDVNAVLPQARGDAEWLTGKDVVAGIADGSVEGYYQLQQEMMVNSGAITAEEQRPVSEYVDMELMTEAGSY
ncbi:ABC transporter substrate-binding protein [Intestinimonas sp.]|uniref:ABC transporter substrate-binding protein n=1 Tax=Intestinimonas sp. TaxID=1965293 RepID=UPI0026115520|nr:ABC transporter substrate-binding protein [Intestinimonas sp.]